MGPYLIQLWRVSTLSDIDRSFSALSPAILNSNLTYTFTTDSKRVAASLSSERQRRWLSRVAHWVQNDFWRRCHHVLNL